MAKGEGLGQKGPALAMAQAPASYIKQTKDFHGVFHLTEVELLGPGVLTKSARAEEQGLPTSPRPPLRRRASKF